MPRTTIGSFTVAGTKSAAAKEPSVAHENAKFAPMNAPI